MAISRLDIDSAVDRLLFINGQGHLIGLPTSPATSNPTTGVPTNGVAGFATGALFFNFKAATLATATYINSGTQASATWNAISNYLGLAVIGVAAGYKLARGTTALDGSNPTPVTTGLATVVGASISLEGSAAPGVGTSVLTQAETNWATGALAVYAWKVTSSSDTTLIASTGTESFTWIAVGT